MVRPALIAALLALLLLGAAAAPARAESPVTRVIYEEAAQPVRWDEVITWAYTDASKAGISGAWVERVLWCEGAGNPYARGAAGEIGPAQFLPRGGVWWDLPESRIVPLDYSRTSLRYQIQAMVGAFARGLAFHWSCK